MWRHLPNLISVLRILLVIPVVQFLLEQRYTEALLIFFIAGASDGLDGFLARHFHWQSHLGAMLDPIGDKLLLVSTYLMLGWSGILPWWLVAVVIIRDVVIVAGAGIYQLLTSSLEMAPSIISKLNTVLQILLVVLVLFTLSDFPGEDSISPMVITLLMYCVLVTTVWSGIDYVSVWGRRAMQASRGHRI